MIILQMSISASTLVLFIIVMRAILLNKLPKKTFIILWDVALFRLLIPISVPSQFSVFTLIKNLTSLLTVQSTSITVPNMGMVETIPVTGDTVANDTLQMVVSPLLILWIVGMLTVALFITITHLRCRQSYKMALPIKNDFLTKWEKEHPTRRTIEIKQSDKITAPLTYGILHPVILLPKSMNGADECKMQYVLAHEFVHIKRFDVLLKYLLAATLCIHWFNPLIWAMYVLANRDIEISCDEVVVKIFGETIKSAYALTLINLEEKKSRLNPLCNNFSKNAIEERITSIMKIKKTSIMGLVFALVLVVGTTTVFATSAEQDKSRIIPSYVSMSDDENVELSLPVFTTNNIMLNKNLAAYEHDIPVNGTVIYKLPAASKKWFSESETYTINLKIVDRNFDYGQGTHIGYVSDGTRTQLFSGQIKKTVSVDFIVPKDGEYEFYVECASSDPLLVESIRIN